MCNYKVRVSDDYSDKSMAGIEVVTINECSLCEGTTLIGFPLDSNLGWYDAACSTEYRCWWISEDYLESITTITRSKFK